MDKQHRNTLIRTVSAPPDWWEDVDIAQTEARITSRSQFIRVAVNWYIIFKHKPEMKQELAAATEPVS